MAADECLEVTTHPGLHTPNPDTVIEVYNGGYWQLINDDFGGTLQSHARIWISAPAATMEFALRVRAYGPYQNSDDFYVTITRRDISESQCTSGQSAIPWAQITQVGGNPQAIVTLSSFHY